MAITLTRAIEVGSLTVGDTKGAAEVSKLVVRTIELVKELFPPIAEGWSNLQTDLREFCKFVHVLELVKLTHYCAQGQTSRYQTVSLYAYTAARVVGAVSYLFSLKVINSSYLFLSISFPSVNILFVISGIFDTAHETSVNLSDHRPHIVTNAKIAIATNVSKVAFTVFNLIHTSGIGLGIVNATWGVGLFAAASPFMLVLGTAAALMGVIRIAHRKANL